AHATGGAGPARAPSRDPPDPRAGGPSSRSRGDIPPRGPSLVSRGLAAVRSRPGRAAPPGGALSLRFADRIPTDIRGGRHAGLGGETAGGPRAPDAGGPRRDDPAHAAQRPGLLG